MTWPYPPGYDKPDAYEAPNGMESVLPGVPDDAGSRDPSSTTVAGAMSNAMAQMREMESDTHRGTGTWIGDQIDLPDARPY